MSQFPFIRNVGKVEIVRLFSDIVGVKCNSVSYNPSQYNQIPNSGNDTYYRIKYLLTNSSSSSHLFTNKN